jgi:hypothetical protein
MSGKLADGVSGARIVSVCRVPSSAGEKPDAHPFSTAKHTNRATRVTLTGKHLGQPERIDSLRITAVAECDSCPGVLII